MKILLVDDERTEREGIRFLIEKFQFELEVAEAANGNPGVCAGSWPFRRVCCSSLSWWRGR